MVAIRLPPEVEERLDALAQRTGRTKTAHAREAIHDTATATPTCSRTNTAHAREAILRYLEDLEDELIALERLDKPDRRWTLDELERELDLER